jgi:hypothetical protein
MKQSSAVLLKGPPPISRLLPACRFERRLFEAQGVAAEEVAVQLIVQVTRGHP